MILCKNCKFCKTPDFAPPGCGYCTITLPFWVSNEISPYSRTRMMALRDYADAGCDLGVVKESEAEEDFKDTVVPNITE